MEDAVYLIAAFCLVFLFIIYLLSVIVHLNKELTESINSFSSKKERMLNDYRIQIKNNKLNEEKKKYLNQKVIGFSNEKSNPIIGVCINYQYDYSTSQEQPLIRDYANNEDIVFKGKMIIFSDLVFNTLYKLNNADIIALLEISDDEDYLSVMSGKLTKYEMKERLENNNFYN